MRPEAEQGDHDAGQDDQRRTPSARWLRAGRVGRPHGLDGSFHVTEPNPLLADLDAAIQTVDPAVEEAARKTLADWKTRRDPAAVDDALLARDVGLVVLGVTGRPDLEHTVERVALGDGGPHGVLVDVDEVDLAKAGRFDWSKVTPLHAIVAGPPITRDAMAVTLFKSLGVGLEDVAAASVIYDRAMASGRFKPL